MDLTQEAKQAPFECTNCGHKPEPYEVLEHSGSCAKCNDTIVAYTVDAAEYIIGLTTDRNRLTAENERLKGELLDERRQLHLITHEKEHLESVESDLTAAKDVLRVAGEFIANKRNIDPEVFRFGGSLTNYNNMLTAIRAVLKEGE